MIFWIASSAQAQVSVNVNIGNPPQWGPVGYSEARYYYLPDVEAYYDIQTAMFIYYTGGAWIHRTYLPQRYRNYDLYSGYKVVMTDYRGNSPHVHYKDHKIKYAKGYHGQPQKTYGAKPHHKGFKRPHGDRPVRGDNDSHGNKNAKKGHGGKHK